MSGHRHAADPSLTQNQGNVLGDRPCVRQSKLYREQVGGNAMKEIMGQDNLKWNTTQTEGVYKGGSVYDHDTDDHRASKMAGQTQQQQAPGRRSHAPGAQQEAEAYGAPQAEQQQQQQPPQGVSESTGRGYRPGAGYANRQTYNIFTGESS